MEGRKKNAVIRWTPKTPFFGIFWEVYFTGQWVENWSKKRTKEMCNFSNPFGKWSCKAKLRKKKTLPGLKCHVYFWGHLGSLNESSNQRSRHSSISVVKHETIRYPLTGASITCCFTSNSHWMQLTLVGWSCKSSIDLDHCTRIWFVSCSSSWPPSLPKSPNPGCPLTSLTFLGCH